MKIKKERFELVYSQGIVDMVEILVDHRSGSAGGLTPLLNKDGTVIVTKDIP